MRALCSRSVGALPPWLPLQCQHNPLAERSRSLSLINVFGAGGSYGSRGGYRPQHGWSRSDPYPLYLMVQSFFLDTREGNHRHKSVWLSRLYFSANLWL
ncbi:hypothetical protein BHM03_00027725 [Ensete ventricosum]|nr:hypothetical protein BHM03_00027725 [Ensete ventricosum]